MLSPSETPPAQPETQNPEPGKGSWIIGVVSVVFALSLLYSGELLTTAWYSATLQKTFAESLARKDIDLNFAVDNPKFKRLFADTQKDVKVLRPVISLVMLEDAGKAAAYIKNQSLPKTAHNTKLLEKLAALSEMNQSSEDGAATATHLETAIDDDFRNYVSLRSAVKAFLAGESTVRMPRAGEEDELEDLNFYESGLLAGLPVIERLPDGIKDLAQLVEYYPLQRSGFPAPIAADLNARLEELRTQGGNLKAEYQSLLAKQDDLEKAAADSKKQEKQLFEETRAVLRDMLIDLAKPQLDSNARRVYGAVRVQVSEKLGRDLPELN